MTQKQDARWPFNRSAFVGTLSLLLSCWLSSPLSAFASSFEIQTFKTHSRLKIRVDSSIETAWKDVPGGFELTLKGLSLQDLQLGDLDGVADPRLQSVRVSEKDGSVVVRGSYRFPAGDLAPASAAMERFQYRENEPAALVIDLWPKGGPTVGDLKRLRAKKDRDQALRKAEAESKRRQDRRATAAQALALQEDVGRFCREPLKDGVDIFLPFYPYRDRVDFEALFPQGYPDEGYPYLEPPKGSPDEKYVRLAHELYEKQSFALVLKTIDFQAKENPKSIYRNDMELLRASALLRLGQKDEAKRVLADIKDRRLGHPVSLYAAMYLANEQRKSENHFASLENYLWLASHYPEFRLAWAFHLAAAEALMALKQTDRAAKEYEWVRDNAPDRKYQALATVQGGNAYLMRFQYDKALAAYFRAIEKFPAEAAASADLQINRAETLYWLGQLDRAEEGFRSFTDRFASHPAGWRAWIRLGEIDGRRDGAAALAKSRQDFIETINRFPFSPGVVLARMRLVPCGDHAGFDSAAAKRFFETDAMAYTGDGQVSLERFRELRSLLRVRSLILTGELAAAIDASFQEREGLSKRSTTAAWLRRTERQIFRKEILKKLNAGEDFAAVQFYDQRAPKLSLEESEADADASVDPDFLLRLSRAASNLGLGRLAEKIAKQYERVSQDFAVSRGIATEGAIKDADLDLKLKRSERAFTEAKAAWISRGADASDAVRKGLAAVVDESPFSAPKEALLALVDERAGRLASAIAHVGRASDLAGHADPATERRLLQWRASLHAKAGNTLAAIESFQKLRARQAASEASGTAREAAGASSFEGLGIEALRDPADWLMAEADLQTKRRRPGEAAKLWSLAVERGVGGNRALYEYAQSLRALDREPKKVRELMEKAAESDTNDFWKELARKTIAGVNAKEGN